MKDPNGVSPDLIDEANRVRVELEELRPALHALLDRAGDVLSAIDLADLGNNATWTDAECEAHDERTGRGPLAVLVAALHDATDYDAMRSDDLDAAVKLDKFELDKFQLDKFQLDKFQLDKFQLDKFQLDKYDEHKRAVQARLGLRRPEPLPLGPSRAEQPAPRQRQALSRSRCRSRARSRTQ